MGLIGKFRKERNHFRFGKTRQGNMKVVLERILERCNGKDFWKDGRVGDFEAYLIPQIIPR